MVDWNLDIKDKTNKIDAVLEKKEAFSMKEIEKLVEDSKTQEIKATMNCLVIGSDGSGKSGIVLSYCDKLPKPTLIIDLDGGCLPLVYQYYKGSKKFLIPPILETMVTPDGIDIDYIKTMAKIKGLIKYGIEHQTEYSAIVLDGLSTLLKFAEYQSRIEKNIAIDGGMQMRYWIVRAKVFTEIVEIMKSAQFVDRFYIAHEDLVATKDSAAVKQKLNAMVHQRIVCRKEESLGVVDFIAKIDKSKYNLGLEGKDFTFATVNGDKTTWDVDKIFKNLL